MPYAEYDPLTTLRSLQGAEAMRNSQSERKRRDLETAEIQRQAAEQQQMRQAAAGAVVPQTAPQVQSGLTIGGQDASMPSPQVQGPPALDRAKLYGNIAANPNIAYQLPGVQAQDAKGQLDHQTAMLQLQEVVGKLQKQGDDHSKAVLEQMNTTADQMGRMAMAVKNAPPELKAQIYQQVLQQAAQNPVLAPRVQQLPQQYDPSMEPMLDSVIAQATDVKSALAKAGETVQLGSGPQGAGVYTKNPLQPNVPGAKLGDLPKTVAPAVNVHMPQEKGVLMSVPDGKGGMVLQRVMPGQSIPQGSGTPTQKTAAEQKASNDEQRRADLANNANENINAFEDIVKRRPELFGPINGRITAAKMVAGSSDPDIAALKAIHEYFGMASVGAHAMRNAQHVKDAANAVMDYNNSPEAMLDPQRGSIARARQSLQTFVNDANKGGKGGSAPAKPSAANDPLGIR